MKRQNLHCHTNFDDGADSPEMMVRAAEKAGLASIGISLHCPIPGEEAWCCAVSNEEAFIAEMRRLRELYAGRLEVWCGLEYDLDADRRTVPPYDYIIGSCHMLSEMPFDYDPDTASQLIAYHGGAACSAQKYYEKLSALAEYPEISVVGHFDLPTKYNERVPLYDTASKAYRDAAFAAMEKLNAAGKIFEINSGAMSRGWRTSPYPSEELLRHLKSIGGRICISSDAHCAAHIDYAFDQCEALARSCGFTEVWQFDGKDFQSAPIIESYKIHFQNEG